MELTEAQWEELHDDINAEARRHSQTFGQHFGNDALDRVASLLGRVDYDELHRQAILEVKASYRRWYRKGGRAGIEIGRDPADMELMESVNS